MVQEKKDGNIEDFTLKSIMRLTSLTNAHVKGSHEETTRWRREIRGEMVRFGSAKFFITINPDDARHPLLLGLNGDEGLLWWKFTSESDFGTYLQTRYKTIAMNPVLQAEFFDIMMTTVLNVLFGFKAMPKVGILGEVASHYFVVESQGKGTLHAHGLVWLTDGKS